MAGLKDLEQYLRQREGEYGVKRLQRAADEIPNLENMYAPDALRRAFSGDNAKALMTMDPARFEKYAERIPLGEDDLLTRVTREGHEVPFDEYLKHLAAIKGGFEDVPFLEIGQRNPNVLHSIEGHEGRHRSRALAGQGVKKSLVQLLPEGGMREKMPRRHREDFINALRERLGPQRLVTPERRSLLPTDLTAPQHQNLERRGLVEGNRPSLPEIYAQGGDVNHFAKGGSEKALHFPPAPALSQAEINAHAERMARQIEGIDNPNNKTKQQLAREQNLPVTIKGVKKADVPVIDYEKLLGSYTVGVPGDPSRGGVVPSKGKKRLGLDMPKAGETLHAIGGEKLDTPVPLYGGKDYGAYGHPAGWASDLGASAGMFNVVKRLAEENPERAVYGHYHKMSPESLNHAVHMLDAVLSHHRPHESSPEQIEMLNHLMRNVATTTGKSDIPYPTFPGFENPADVMLHGSMNSGMRKKIIGLLGKEKNFPGGKQKLDDIIYAISHPELRNIETGAGGNAVIKFDPTRELRESISPHPTYGHDIPSELVGKTRYITPMEILAPRSYNNSVQRNIGKPVMPFNDAKMNIIREPIDQQYVDQMKAYEEAMRKRLGYAKGGDVKELSIHEMQTALANKKPHMADGGQAKNPFDYENPEHVANVVKIAAQHKLLAPITDVHKHLADILSGGHYKHIEDPNIQDAIRQAGHDAYFVAEKSGKQRHVMKKAVGGNVEIGQVGAEEAPNLPVKDYILPHGQHPGQLPVGGIDMQPAVPGQQLWPTQPPAQPQQGQQPGQPQPGQPPRPGQPQPPSNILQMTPQGQAMNAMSPPQPTAMARGGSVPSKYEVKPYHDDEGKRVGWSVHEGDYIHDVYPTKAYATNVMKQWIEHDKKKNEPQQAKKGGTIKPVGHGITKEKVTISPNLDAMQYELMSVKHFKKAK